MLSSSLFLLVRFLFTFFLPFSSPSFCPRVIILFVLFAFFLPLVYIFLFLFVLLACYFLFIVPSSLSFLPYSLFSLGLPFFSDLFFSYLDQTLSLSLSYLCGLVSHHLSSHLPVSVSPCLLAGWPWSEHPVASSLFSQANAAPPLSRLILRTLRKKPELYWRLSCTYFTCS